MLLEVGVLSGCIEKCLANIMSMIRAIRNFPFLTLILNCQTEDLFKLMGILEVVKLHS